MCDRDVHEDRAPWWGRRPTLEELRDILAAHRQWVESDGREGQPADLRGAILEEADFWWANLQGANLRHAILRNADLAGSTGLLEGALAGADLAGARLPAASVDTFFRDGLARVSESSGNAAKLYVSMLAGCLYSWLTIHATTDARLLTNSPSSPLPVLQAEIPIVGFYVVAPLLLLALYVYFHLHLQRHWEGLAALPAVFPDGRRLDEKIDSWLVNGLVSAHVPQLRGRPPVLSCLQALICGGLIWWLVPPSLLFFWIRYLPRHHWLVTGLHILLLAGSIGAAIGFQRLARNTLRGLNIWGDARAPMTLRAQILFVARSRFGAAVALFFVLFSMLSYGAITGVHAEDEEASKLGYLDPRRRVPQALEWIRYSPFANLDEVDVSTKPGTWTGEDNAQIPLVKGASLRRRDLRFARAWRAFLVKADLRSANLYRADLHKADLREARLEHAAPKEEGADLSNADLHMAQLDGANLTNADLRGADLRGACLWEAKLWFAKLQRADLGGADLRGADLGGAEGLTQSQINSAVINGETKLPDGLQRSAPANPNPNPSKTEHTACPATDTSTPPDGAVTK